MDPLTVNIFGGFAVLGLTVAWIGYLFAHCRRVLKTPFISALLLLTFTGGLVVAVWAIRRDQAKRWEGRLTQLGVVAAGAQPLIASIRAFEKKNGSPPPSLAALPATAAPSTEVAATALWLYGDPEMIIGPPTVPKTRWAVGVKVKRSFCTRCGLSFGDTFVYHSDEDYPERAYGGVLERVGTWAYYHE